MHAGVRPARPDNLHLSLIEHSDNAFELALYRPRIFLHLPAVKIGTVVLDEESEIHLGNSSSNLSQHTSDLSLNVKPFFRRFLGEVLPMAVTPIFERSITFALVKCEPCVDLIKREMADLGRLNNAQRVAFKISDDA